MNHHHPSPTTWGWWAELCRLACRCCAVVVLMPLASFSADSDRPVRFTLPADDAVVSLKEFARQSDQRLLYAGEAVRGVRTQPVQGVYTPRAALELMLRDSGLVIAQDQPSGVVAVYRPGANPAPDGEHNVTQPQNQMKKHTKVVAWVLALFGWTAAANLPAQSAPDRPVDSAQGPSTKYEKDADKRNNEEKILELPAYQVTSTAQKDSIQRVFDIPIPVTVVSAKTLVETNQLRLQDFATRFPGVTVVPAGRTNTVVIRGLYSGGTPTVAYVIDEIPFGWNDSTPISGLVPDLDPGDMASIEVLRGPQGTLYGASSLGGLIKYVTSDPLTTGYSGRLSIGTTTVVNGDKMGYNVRGSLNMPLSETLGLGFSGFSRREPGFIDRLTGGSGINEIRSKGGRMSAMWRPSSDWTLKFNVIFQEREQDGSPYAQTELGEFVQDSTPVGESYHFKFQTYSGTLTGKVGAGELTSITGYSIHQADHVQEFKGFAPYMGPPDNPPFTSFSDVDYESPGIERFTQELRLALPVSERVDVMLGGYYADAAFNEFVEFFGADASGIRVDNGVSFSLINRLTFSEIAAFANITIKVTDRFDIQLGGRQSAMKQSFQSETIQDSTIFNIPLGLGPKNQFDPEAFTYLLAPRLRVSPDMMVYGRLASGYRVGGTNAATFCGEGIYPCGYGPDTSINYELGVKGNFLGHMLSVDASIYLIDWKDIQLSLTADRDGVGFPYTGNGGKGRSQGVELSMEFRPRDGLTIAGWVAWNNAELTETSSLGVKGDRLAFGTDWTGRLSVNQSFPLARRLRGFVEGVASYVGEREAGVGTSRLFPNNNYPDYVNYDFSAGVRFPSRWSANLFVTNLTDERGAAQGNPSLRPASVIYIQPRTIGVNFTREF